jgi:hypothetical protein
MNLFSVSKTPLLYLRSEHVLRTQSNPERARRVAGREKWSSSSPALICSALDCSQCEAFAALNYSALFALR